MTETDQPPPLSASEKLAATLAALEAERLRRRGGVWSEIPTRIVYGGRLSEYLAKEPSPSPPPPGCPHEMLEIVIIDPDPVVELPWMQRDADHVGAHDVTPPPRPAIPPLSPPPAPRDEPLTYSNAGIPRGEHERELKRLERFNSGDWGDPMDHPLRYPRGNRNGW
jgi:hypothetical protein